MADWNVVSETPVTGTPPSSSDWKVAKETPIASESDTAPERKIKAGLPTLEKYVPDILKSGLSGAAETTAKVAAAPFDIGAEAGNYATNRVMDLTEGVPAEHVAKRVVKDTARKGIETAMTPVELGAKGASYIANKLGASTDFNSPTQAAVKALGLGAESTPDKPGVPNVGDKIVDTLGLDYKPKTTPGEVAKFAGSVAPFPAASALKADVIGQKVLDATDYVLKKSKFEPPKLVNENTKAARAIVENLKSAQEAGGSSPRDVLKMVKEARAAGKPLSIADVGGDVNQRLAGVVYRKGGSAREIIKKALTERDAQAAERLKKSTNKYLGSGSIRQTIKDLAAARSAEGNPVFTEAMKGGSLAPLEKQYETEFNAASKQVEEHSAEVSKLLKEVTKYQEEIAKGQDVTVSHQKLRAAQFKLSQKEAELKQAHDDKEMTLEHLRSSQTDRAMGAPGAVWNPRIQRLIDNPRVKAGMAKGYQIERDLSDAEGRTFDPKEYAVTGEKDGEPIVGRVPNMRILAAGKTGLDNMLANNPAMMRDLRTGKRPAEGMAVEKLRNALVKELDAANPKYKEAREVWAGPSGSIDAVNAGESAFLRNPEENVDIVGKMTKSEKEFAQMGLAEKIREKILKTGFSGDEAKAVIKNPWMKEQIRPFFNSDKEMDAFIKDVTDERTMFESGVAIAKNSFTADRQAADAVEGQKLAMRAARGVVDGLRGAWWNSLHTLITLRGELGLRNNPELNAAIAKLMFDPKADMSQLERMLPEELKSDMAPPAAAGE